MVRSGRQEESVLRGGDGPGSGDPTDSGAWVRVRAYAVAGGPLGGFGVVELEVAWWCAGWACWPVAGAAGVGVAFGVAHVVGAVVVVIVVGVVASA
ncbi:hypothetical protein [Corynebacterium sp. Marseille-Q2516]